MKFVQVDIDTFLKYRERYARYRHVLTDAEWLRENAQGFGLDFFLAKDDEGHGRHVACGYVLAHDFVDPENIELLSLFNAAGYDMGYGDLALEDAVRNGARILSCFDGFLVGWYAARGWEAVGTTPFVDEIAPRLWIPDIDGRPNVITMRITQEKLAELLVPEPDLRQEVVALDDFSIGGQVLLERHLEEANRRINAMIDVDPETITLAETEPSPRPKTLGEIIRSRYTPPLVREEIDDIVYSTPGLLERAAMTDEVRTDLVQLQIADFRPNAQGRPWFTSLSTTIFERSAALIQKRRLEAENGSRIEVSLVPITVRRIDV